MKKIVFLACAVFSLNAQFNDSETLAPAVKHIIFSYDGSQTLKDAAERICSKQCAYLKKQWTGLVGEVIEPKQQNGRYYSTCECK